MADVQPFRAIRYNPQRYADLTSVIAPPYDVLDKAGKDKLLSRSDRNIVSVDLPYLPPKTVGPDAVYAAAAEQFRAWLSDGTLKQDDQAAFYAYTQSYTVRGRRFDRRGLFALVRLEPFSTPANPTNVVPHEKTYAGPIEDRMKLMNATGVQLSPIFGLFPDEDGTTTALVHDGLGSPAASGTLDNVENKLWPVTDSAKQHAHHAGPRKNTRLHRRRPPPLHHRPRLPEGRDRTERQPPPRRPPGQFLPLRPRQHARPRLRDPAHPPHRRRAAQFRRRHPPHQARRHLRRR